jgi:hypothetical protein
MWPFLSAPSLVGTPGPRTTTLHEFRKVRRQLRVTSVVLCNRRLPVNFRYASRLFNR